jgi:hypothetical protein
MVILDIGQLLFPFKVEANTEFNTYGQKSFGASNGTVHITNTMNSQKARIWDLA